MGWLNRRRAQESPDEAVRSLVTHLSSGNPLAPMAPTMVTQPGETQYADIVVGCHAFYGTNVEYSSGYAVQGGPRAALPSARSAPTEVPLAERLAEQVDPLPPDRAAEILSGHPATTVEKVLDLIGTRKAREVRASLQSRREG
ncbi:hypothetical protein [Streptomyces sp. NPDC004050]